MIAQFCKENCKDFAKLHTQILLGKLAMEQFGKEEHESAKKQT